MSTEIYTLQDDKGTVRYVGKTMQGLQRRLTVHMITARSGERNHRCNWLRSCLTNGYIPTIQRIDCVNGDGCKEEMYWIKEYRRRGSNLTNATDGGEGTLGCVPSAETRRKLSEAGKSRVVTAETRKKISDKAKGNKYALGHVQTEEERRKHSEAMKGKLVGRKHSEETKLKISEAGKRRGFVQSKEHKLKIYLAHKGSKRSDEAKQKMREAWKRRKAMACKLRLCVEIT